MQQHQSYMFEGQVKKMPGGRIKNYCFFECHGEELVILQEVAAMLGHQNGDGDTEVFCPKTEWPTQKL
jgi:hypothetical protein